MVHKDGAIKEPMNVTVSILSHYSTDYDIHVMAVLRADAGFYQTRRLQCKDLSQELSGITNYRNKLIRWSCLPLDCDSETVLCQDPGYSGTKQDKINKCNKYKCCPKDDAPNAWKADVEYKNLCAAVTC